MLGISTLEQAYLLKTGVLLLSVVAVVGLAWVAPRYARMYCIATSLHL